MEKYSSQFYNYMNNGIDKRENMEGVKLGLDELVQ